MPHISSKKLNERVWKRLHARFLKTILDLTDNTHGRSFVSDLLTTTEQVMLAKRLAIIFLPLEGVSAYRIAELLKVSHSTVLRIHEGLDRGRFGAIESLCKIQKNRRLFWRDIHTAVKISWPTISGSGRWKWLDEMDEKYGKY